MKGAKAAEDKVTFIHLSPLCLASCNKDVGLLPILLEMKYLEDTCNHMTCADGMRTSQLRSCREFLKHQDHECKRTRFNGDENRKKPVLPSLTATANYITRVKGPEVQNRL